MGTSVRCFGGGRAQQEREEEEEREWCARCGACGPADAAARRRCDPADPRRTFKGTAIFVIKSDDGVRRYYLDLRDSASVELDAESGREAASDIMLTMGEATLMKLVKGSLSPQMAFMAGKLKLRGEVSLAMKLQKVFALLRPAAKM